MMLQRDEEKRMPSNAMLGPAIDNISRLFKDPFM